MHLINAYTSLIIVAIQFEIGENLGYIQLMKKTIMLYRIYLHLNGH